MTVIFRNAFSVSLLFCAFSVTLCVSSAVGIHPNWDDNFTTRDAEKRRGNAEDYFLLSACSYRQEGSAVSRDLPQRHREHRVNTEKKRRTLARLVHYLLQLAAHSRVSTD